jgi:hypothetical protein
MPSSQLAPPRVSRSAHRAHRDILQCTVHARQHEQRNTQNANNAALTPTLDAPGTAQAGDNSYNYAAANVANDRDVETAVVSGPTAPADLRHATLGMAPRLAACCVHRVQG